MTKKDDKESKTDGLNKLFANFPGGNKDDEPDEIYDVELEFPDSDEIDSDDDDDLDLDFENDEDDYESKSEGRPHVYHEDYRHFEFLNSDDELSIWGDGAIWMLHDKDQKRLIDFVPFYDNSATDFTTIAYEALTPENQEYARAMVMFGRKHIRGLYLETSFEKYAIPFLLKLQNFGFEKASMSETLDFIVGMMNKNVAKHRHALEQEIEADFNDLLHKMKRDAREFYHPNDD